MMTAFFQHVPIGGMLLLLCVATGALLDALLLTALTGWPLKLFHGAVVTLYVLENWALLRDLQVKTSALLVQTDARDEALRCIQQLKEEAIAQTKIRVLLEEENQRLMSEASWHKDAHTKDIDHWNKVWHASSTSPPPLPANELNCRAFFTTPCASKGRRSPPCRSPASGA